MATINNVVASWSMIQLQIQGSDAINDAGGESAVLIDATSIKWNASRKVENVYGLGGQVRGRGFGNVTYTASIVLPYHTQHSLQAMGGGTLMGLGEFNLVISWTADLAASVSYYTTTLQKCFFNESSMEANQDDTSITHEYDLHPYRIFNSQSATGTNWGLEMYSK